MDPDVGYEEKKEKMAEWWNKHFDLLIASGLNKKNLDRVVEEGAIELREGTFEFLDFLKDYKIPLVILSSSGLGEVIPMYLEKHGKNYDNIHVVTNLYEWDDDGVAVGVKKPIIHSMNKDETSIKGLPIYNELKRRKNVLLLGNSLGDLGMIEGFEYDNLIKVGFLDEKIEENLAKFKEGFDVVLTGDADMSYVNGLVKGFVGK
jgi:5'-nucleotidase